VTPTQVMLGTLSDNAIRCATGVMLLAMGVYAARWAMDRERATAAVPATREPALVGAVTPADLGSGLPTTAGPDPEAAVTERAAGSERTRRAETLGRIAFNLFVLAGAVLVIGVVLRGVAAERVPWSNMYEFATAGSAGIFLVFMGVRSRLRLQWLEFPLSFFLLVMLGLATTVLYTPVSGLIPALQSYWLAIHVTAAVTGTAVFSVGFLITVMQLVRIRQESAGKPSRLPPSASMDTAAYRLNAFAFPIWTFALIAGAIWAQHAWGRFWGWDPKEVWMFITWVSYACYLHARATPGWRRRLPWIGVVAYATIFFNLVVVNVFITGLHSYAGV
jgi:cytochrome c-type biogenesis protein CcsB